MAEVGRPTELTEECLLKIKEGILNGETLKKIANICGIAEQTIYDWTCKNYKDINTKIEGWRRDRKVNLASENIDEILTMDITNKGITKDGKEIYEYDDTGKLRIKADISKFVLEALDKPYKPKQDFTSDDKPIQQINYVQPNGGNNNNASSDTETTPSI